VKRKMARALKKMGKEDEFEKWKTGRLGRFPPVVQQCCNRQH
jgi:hypothetical protein